MLGGDANIAIEYATKRYRSNLINWGLLPFTIEKEDQDKIQLHDYVYIPNIRQALQSGAATVEATASGSDGIKQVTLKLENLSPEDRDIITAGCLMNYYSQA